MFLSKKTKKLPRYKTIEKRVGETPLEATERLRTEHNFKKETPLAYAGRLDPMASGKLLVLIGDECKVQKKYHSFDKEYQVEILLGAHSDTGDVLGVITSCPQHIVSFEHVCNTFDEHVGPIELPYPHYCSKTVHGKPLHTWALEKRLHEIEIPIKKSTIHKLTFSELREASRDEVLETVRKKIETIPKVTDLKKVLGADFRRDEVRASWNQFEGCSCDKFQILSFTCVASSGTYMRSLSQTIAQRLGTCGLAYSIHRTKIGKYAPFTKKYGIWMKQF